MRMTPEDRFVQAIGAVESRNNPTVELGDHGRAAGRFQQHPTFYASWQPTIEELRGMREPSWDQCFELALRKFWRKQPPGKKPDDVAIAYHLHGQHIYSGDDPLYRSKFAAEWAALHA